MPTPSVSSAVNFICTDGVATVLSQRACNASSLLRDLIDANVGVVGDQEGDGISFVEHMSVSHVSDVALALPHPTTCEELEKLIRPCPIYMGSDVVHLQRLILAADALLCNRALKRFARDLQRLLCEKGETYPCLLPTEVLERCGDHLAADDWLRSMVDGAIRAEKEGQPLDMLPFCLLRYTAKGIVSVGDDGRHQGTQQCRLRVGEYEHMPLADYPFVDRLRRLTLLPTLGVDDMVALQPILQHAQRLYALHLPHKTLEALSGLSLPALCRLRVTSSKDTTFEAVCRGFRQAPQLRRIMYESHNIERINNLTQGIIDAFPHLEALELRNVCVTDEDLDLLAERLDNLVSFACHCELQAGVCLTEHGVVRFLQTPTGQRLTKFCLTGFPSTVLTRDVLLHIASLPRLCSLWLSLSFAPKQVLHRQGLRAIVANPLLRKFVVWQSPTKAGWGLFFRNHPCSGDVNTGLFGNPDLELSS